MKKNIKSNKTISIVLTVLVFVLTFVAVEYSTSQFSGWFIQQIVQHGQLAPVNIVWENAGPFFAFLLAAGIILLFKFYFTTRLARENNKQSSLVKAIFVLEIILIVILFASAFSIFMHPSELTLERMQVANMPMVIFTTFASGLTLTTTILNAVNDLRK